MSISSARHNPFATDRVERVLTFNPAWADTTWDEINERWKSLNQRVSITGRHGAGKTTFLDAWKPHLTTNGYNIISLFLNHEKPKISPQSWQKLANVSGKIILIDGEEQLGWRQRRRLYQIAENASGLIVTRHSPGKSPTLLHLDPPISILHHCVQTLSPEHYSMLKPHLSDLWKQHKGNIREILLCCYDHVR